MHNPGQIENRFIIAAKICTLPFDIVRHNFLILVLKSSCILFSCNTLDPIQKCVQAAARAGHILPYKRSWNLPNHLIGVQLENWDEGLGEGNPASFSISQATNRHNSNFFSFAHTIRTPGSVWGIAHKHLLTCAICLPTSDTCERQLPNFLTT